MIVSVIIRAAHVIAALLTKELALALREPRGADGHQYNIGSSSCWRTGGASGSLTIARL